MFTQQGKMRLIVALDKRSLSLQQRYLKENKIKGN